MQEITDVFGRPTGMYVAPNDNRTKVGVISEECDSLVPFEYDFIDSEVAFGNVVLAKKDNQNVIIEL